MQKRDLHNVASTNFNLKEEIENYISQWKWFVLGVLFFLSIAYVYLRYSIPQYKATATLLVKDDRKGGLASELTAFSDLGLLSGVKSNVDNEIEVIKSRTLIASTIKDLGLTIAYLNLGRVKSEELYKVSPIQIFFSDASDEFLNTFHTFRISSVNSNQFDFYDGAGVKLGTFSYGTKFKIGGVEALVMKSSTQFWKEEFTIAIQVFPIKSLVESFKSRLTVSSFGKNTSVIELTLVDPVREKAEDFLNTLVINYNKDAVADKKYIAENTSKFIEQRLKIISDELKTVEADVETFKKQNQVTDIVSEAGLFIENASEFDKKEIEVSTQMKIVTSILDYVKSDAVTNLIPANILPPEEGASQLIAQYNQLVLERNRLLKSAGDKNSLVVSLDAKIASLKSTIAASLNQLQSSLQIKKSYISRQKALLGGKIAQIPTQEKIFRDIDRKQNIKEALYLYLLQKREETEISLAVTAPNAKVIDSAIASKNPVTPNRKLIYLGSLFLGLLLPFSVLYVRRLLDTKVKSRLDIETATTIPFLGDVPKSENKDEIIATNSRTNIAEALRIIRTNLEFMLPEVSESTAKTIFLTSTFPKEGKTFISVNLAATIALSDKKVILVGMDIRNPKLEEYLAVPTIGLTNYLATPSTDLATFISKVPGYSNFHVLPAGIIPPNPAELLMSKKVGELFEKLKQDFDYIIVDTAPVSLVTDTLLISKYADAFVYVTRANYLDKRMLTLPEKLFQEKKLPNMSILINDTDVAKGYGYGYGYGYGVESEKQSFWKRIFS